MFSGKSVRALSLIGVLGVLSVALVQLIAAQEKGGADVTGPYEYVKNWPQDNFFEKGWTWGSTPGIFAESADRVYVNMRGELPVLNLKHPDNALELIEAVIQQSRAKPRMQHMVMVFDRNGKLVESWEQQNSEFVNAHTVAISPYDPEKHVWIVDHVGDQVLKFTNDGKKLVMRIGEKGVPGNDKTHLNWPSGIAFMPNGDFYITDGYRNTRVVRFDKDGKYMFEFGKPGHTAPGEFDTPHSMAIDAQHRLYVSDRNNSRIQVFDEHGKFIEMWPNIPLPYFLYISKDQHIWVGDGTVHKILKYDLHGKLLYSWGTFGRRPGELWGPHAISVDNEGNLYIANAQGNNVSKFRPKKGADPDKLIGPMLVLPTKTSIAK